jgi:hypothetical protein
MKSLYLAALAALALAAGSAQAQHLPFGHGHFQGGCPGGHCGGHMGGHVTSKFGGWFGGKLFSGIFCNHGSLFGKEDHGHGFGAFGGFGAGLFGGGGGQPIPVVDPRMGGNAGQLVFPQHPFVRGPRDYFMLEDR